MKLVTLFFLALVFAFGADGATFRLEHDGAVLMGGEVCLFEARSTTDPLQRMTAFRDVSCSSADRDVPLPRGQWNLFARHRDGYVSRSLLLVDKGQVENGARTIPLVPSATIRIEAKLDKGDTAAAYVEETGHVVPLVPGEDFILVPAGRKILPLFMSNGNVRSVGVARTTRRGDHDLANRAGVATAVGLVPDVRAFERIAPRDRAAATVLLTHERNAVPPVNAIDPAFEGRPAIAFFSHPVALTGVARLSGAGWSVDEVNVTASRADRPLTVAPTTTLSVHWSLIDDPIRLAEQLRQTPTCPVGDETTRRDVKGVEDKGLTLTIARCPGLQAAVPAMSVRKESCTSENTIPLDDTEVAGVAVLNDVAAGVHLLRLGYEGLPPIFQVVEVDRENAEADVELKYDRWFGKVTRDGEPVHVKVDIGNGAITDPDTGEYFTISTPRTAPPPDIAHRLFKEPPPVHLVGCTGEKQFFYVPDKTPTPNARFDIEIASNTVEVAVRDSESDAKIEGAKVVYSAIRKTEPERILFGGAVGVTDPEGSVSVADVPPDVEMQFCATHDSYQQKCADRFTMKTLRSHRVTITLDPAVVRHGRVLHPNATEGRVQWFTPAGEVSETASIKSDGSFTYKSEHGSNEIVAVIAARTPLLVMRQPNVGGEVFEIKFPPAPVRTYTVTLLPGAKETKGFLTLSVGDIAVPLQVIGAHLRERDMRPLFLSPGSIVFHDIVAHAPVAFIFAPMSWAETHAAGSTRDAFYVPAAMSLPRFPAGNDGSVVIGGEQMRKTPEALAVNARR